MTVGPTAEAEAESFGFLARQVKDGRESNPYLMHLQQHSPLKPYELQLNRDAVTSYRTIAPDGSWI